MPSRIRLRPRTTPTPPGEGDETLFLDVADGALKSIDSTGTVTNVEGSPGGGSLTLDNTVDAPAEVTRIVATGATIDGDEATLRGKDFYAQDTDPGAVGYGSVWKDTGPATHLWYTRNIANDGWEPYIEIAATSTGADSAGASLNAYASEGGDATATVRANAEGAGVADARTTVSSLEGTAWAGRSATTYGAGNADAGSIAQSEGAGNATATVTATAVGDGQANVYSVAEAQGAGIAEAGSLAKRLTVHAGMYATVEGDGTPKLGFNAVAATGGITIPEIPASPTEQDIVDVLVALGLATQAA